MKKWLYLFIGCMAWSNIHAMTLEEQYSGLRNCHFDGVFYDQKTKQLGPKSSFFKENKNKLEICWQSENITSFCPKLKLTFYGLDVKELTVSGVENDYFGIVFFNDEEVVNRILSQYFILDVAGNENGLPSVDILPEDGLARIYCNLYNNK